MPGREGGGQALGVGPEDEPVSDEVGPCPDRVGVHNELSAPQVRNYNKIGRNFGLKCELRECRLPARGSQAGGAGGPLTPCGRGV